MRPAGPGLDSRTPRCCWTGPGAARKLEKIPSAEEYEQAGRFSGIPFTTRYRRWRCVPDEFAKFARKDGVERDWRDVLEMIATRKENQARREAAHEGRGRRSQKECVMRDRPIYGSPLGLPELAYAPVNEAGVVFAFGIVARRLGFTVLRIQTEFPDCEAMREVARGQLQRVRIEFEFESRNFLKHGHRKDGCDVIICWSHNWPECPKNMEVIELRKVLRGLGDRA